MRRRSPGASRRSSRGGYGSRRKQGVPAQGTLVVKSQRTTARDAGGRQCAPQLPQGPHDRLRRRTVAEPVHPALGAREGAALRLRGQGSDPGRAGLRRLLRRDEPHRRRAALGERDHAGVVRLHGDQQGQLQVDADAEQRDVHGRHEGAGQAPARGRQEDRDAGAARRLRPRGPGAARLFRVRQRRTRREEQTAAPGDREDDRRLARDGLPRHEGARDRRLHRAAAGRQADAAREDQLVHQLTAGREILVTMARASAVAASSGRGVPGRNQAAGFGLPERAMRLVQEARWIAVAALGAFLLLILLTYDKADPGWSHAIVTRTTANAGGRVGAWFADLLLYLFGLSAYLLVILLGVSVTRGLRTLRASAPEPVSSQRFAWERWLGFGLLLLGCVGIESARLHSLQADLPLGPGGIVGAVITDPLFVALGPVGGTLVLLVLVAAGFSLWSGWSWLTIFERIGFALEWAVQRLVQAVVARRDRRIGEVAATERDEQVQVKRRILDDDPEPIRIETPVARIERSERAEAERQSVLFVDLPADTQLPPVSLLDDPPVAAEGVSQE